MTNLRQDQPSIPCFRCNTQFTRRRRGPVSHHCATCRSAVDREKRRARALYYRARAETFHAALPEDIGVVVIDDVADYLAKMDGQGIAMDRQPAGWKTPRGSDDGRSTYDETFAGELDTLAAAITDHICKEEGYTAADCGQCFWDKNPHWCVDL